MAQLQHGPSRSFQTSDDLSLLQYSIVALDTTKQNHVVIAASGTDKIVGVVGEFATKGDVGDTVVVTDKAFSTKLLMGASCNIGDLITADSGGSGKGAVTTADKDFVVGRALEASGADGDIIEVQLLMTYLSV